LRDSIVNRLFVAQGSKREKTVSGGARDVMKDRTYEGGGGTETPHRHLGQYNSRGMKEGKERIRTLKNVFRVYGVWEKKGINAL